MKPRLVLDTNVWLDWLVFDDPGIAPIRDAAGARRVEVYIDAVCEAELAGVLARGFAKRVLDAKAQALCIAQCRRIAKRIDAPAPAPAGMLPLCRDPDDQKFLEAALRREGRVPRHQGSRAARAREEARPRAVPDHHAGAVPRAVAKKSRGGTVIGVWWVDEN